jgi:soluble lytic murein transglycosylase-like protein
MSKTFQSTILSLFLLFGIHTESSANTVEWIRDVCDDCSESYAKIIMHSVHVAAMEYDVDPNLILKVIKVESRFNPSTISEELKDAVSSTLKSTLM